MATITLDNLISESGRRTGIGAAAEPLTRELLQFMTRGPGGLGGFVDRFRSAGLGAEIASFLGGRSEAVLPAKTVEQVIGESAVASMARRAGVAPAAASSALGFEIPRLIGMLMPGGKAPAALPPEIQDFVAQQEQVSPVAMATVRQEEQVRPTAMATVRTRGGRSLAWLWALLALGVLAGVLWAVLSRTRAPAPLAPRISPPAVSTPAIKAPSVNAPALNAPALSASGAPASVASIVSALNLDLRQVLTFPTARAELPAASGPQLQQAADRIKALPAGTVIEIAGHTDNTGDAAANMTLSQRRADAVRDALIKDGVEPSMLTARGYGETRPLASNDTAEGRRQNRRTEFAVADIAAGTTTTTTR